MPLEVPLDVPALPAAGQNSNYLPLGEDPAEVAQDVALEGDVPDRQGPPVHRQGWSLVLRRFGHGGGFALVVSILGPTGPCGLPADLAPLGLGERLRSGPPAL